MLPVDPSSLPVHAHSYSDPESRVRVGDDAVVRTVARGAAPRFRALFEDGLVDDLVARGLLVESALDDGRGADGGLVVRHRRLDPLTYPHEWPFSLLCAAAIALLETARAAAAFGRTVADGHPWNIVLDPATRRPRFVDLGSFWPIAQSQWVAEAEFLRYVLHPLGLMSAGQRGLARLLLAEEDGVGAESLRALARGLRSRPVAEASREQYASFHRTVYDRLARRVESLRAHGAAAAAHPRRRSGAEQVGPARGWLERAGARRIVDLSAAIELTAPTLAVWGTPVVALTRDEGAADRLVEHADRERLPLLPLVVDPLRPTPGRGVLDYWQIAATDRLRAEAVVALGVVEAAAERRLTVDHAVEAVAQFAPRIAIVGGGRAEHERAELRRALARRFARVEEAATEGGVPPLLIAHEARPRSWHAA